MDKELFLLLVCFAVFPITSSASKETVAVSNSFGDSTHGPVCNETRLQRKTGDCCWCNEREIQCDLTDNAGMNFTLFSLKELNYTFMEKMTFLLNNSWRGYFPVIVDIPMNLSLLEHFTELRQLWIMPSKHQTHSVPLYFTNATFKGCRKLEELHINIPLLDTPELQWMIKPLHRLKVLDFNNVRGISYRNMNATANCLPRGIRKLQLSHFQSIGQTEYLTVFITNQFFIGTFNELEEINLSDNGFALVYTGWYNATPNLKHLDMSHNGLTYSSNVPFLLEALMHPSITVFNHSFQGFYDPLNRYDHFNYEARMNKSCIWNDTSTPQASAKHPFPIHFPVMTAECLDRVTNYNFSNLAGNTTTVFCAALRHCSFDSWRYLSCDNLPLLKDIINNDCNIGVEVPLGQNLREVYMASNFLDPMSHTGVIMHGVFCFRANNLTKVDFSRNYFWANNAKIAETISAVTEVKNAQNLQELNLDSNDFRLNMTAAAVTFPNLTVLTMSDNFAHIKSGVSLCQNKQIHSLKDLDLSYNKLNYDVKWNLIKNCTHLERLNLRGNELTSDFFLCLDGTDRLENISLASNNIGQLSGEFIAELESRRRGVRLNISDNPLVCGCSALHFVKWLQDSSRKTIIDDFDDATQSRLVCTGSNGFQLLDQVDHWRLWMECTNFIPIVTSVCVSFGISALTLAVWCAWRKRSLIRYKYIRCIQWLQRQCGFERRPEYKHDAFVIYSSEDRFWVHDVLARTLQDTYGFRLFVHELDILPGMNEQREIDKNLFDSREFILVISRKFLDDHWSHMLMVEAYQETLKRGTNIITIVLGTLPRDIHEPTARHILKANTLEFRDVDPVNKDAAAEKQRSERWQQLAQHLYGNVSCCCCGREDHAAARRQERSGLLSESGHLSVEGAHASNYGSTNA